MKNFKNLIGMKFGKLTVIEPKGKNKYGKKIWLCKCECGNIHAATTGDLKSGNVKSCGCSKKVSKRYINLVGKRFGKLLVIAETKKRNPTMFLCKCECGNEIEIRSGDLLSNHSRCCAKCRNITHGDSKTRLYKIWKDIKTRCFNSNNKYYKDYGGRGINICDEWQESYSNFKRWALLNGYEETLTIDRINVDGNYEPSNCRWATRKEQNNNQRRSQITINGKTMSAKQWCQYTGINYNTFMSRRHTLHESIERALRID